MDGDIAPAIEKFCQREYSLEPDMLNGWRARIIESKQIPLEFYYPITENLVYRYTQDLLTDKLVYLGPRYHSNISAIQQYAYKTNNKLVKQSFVYNQELQRFNYQYQKVKTQVRGQDRPFTGMNPYYKIQQSLIFDSDFECGNLDLVVKTNDNQYDLFMRVDTNTKGHFSWFFFKAISKKPQKVKFNICNFHKSQLLYSKGMRPYVFSRYGKGQWQQKGTNVNYQLNEKYSFQNCKNIYSLSFEIEFKKQELQLWFAYSIPYSYSYLLNFLERLKELPYSEQFLKVQSKYKSTSGLRIPVLTIGQNKQDRKTVMITGRMHPGETQGSWMLHNFISFLCSQKAQRLRSQIVFKIIPMVNVDGVVLGNFRTNIKGSDVNREYNFEKRAKENTESYCVREIASESSSSLLAYMDFHGHSTRKGVFIFGPQYSINQQEYYTSRIYPKILSLETEMFRYYSCIFRISESKVFTARAAMFRHYKIPYVFTIQASSHSYIDSNNQQILFSEKLYKDMGDILYKKFEKTVPILIAFETQKQNIRKMRNLQVQLDKRLVIEEIYGQKTSPIKMKRKSESLTRAKSKQRQLSPKKSTGGLHQLIEMFPELSNIFKEIKSQKIISNVQQDDKSDCESEDQNYNKEELKRIFSRKKKIVHGKSLIHIKREQIKELKTVKENEKEKEKEREKSPNRVNPFKLESRPHLYKKMVLENGFIGKIKTTDEPSPYRSIKRLDLQGKQLPSIDNSPKQKSIKTNIRKQKLYSRNKTLEREYQKHRPLAYQQTPLSHRHQKQYKKSLGNEAHSLQKQIVIEDSKHINFPWVEPSIKLTKQSTEPRQALMKLGVPKLTNQITQVSIRRDYIRRKAKTNRSYQLTNLSLDLYH